MSIELAAKIVGHQWATNLLTHAVKSNTMPQSLLITGLPQLGKTTLAHQLALTLNCQAETKPCGKCLPCRKIAAGNHPDVLLLKNKHEALKIEAIRALQKDLTLRPHESNHKIAILSNFERATPNAANALLKTLEEPPSHAILILTAGNSSLLLPTIVSRCQVLALRPVPPTEIATMLQTRYQAEPDSADLVAHLAQGRPGWAVDALQDKSQLLARQTGLQDLETLLQQNFAQRLKYSKMLANQKTSPTALLELWLSWWRDVLLVRLNPHGGLTNRDFRNSIEHVAATLPVAEISKALQLNRQTLKNFNYNVNTRLNLDVLLLNWPTLPANLFATRG